MQTALNQHSDIGVLGNNFESIASALTSLAPCKSHCETAFQLWRSIHDSVSTTFHCPLFINVFRESIEGLPKEAIMTGTQTTHTKPVRHCTERDGETQTQDTVRYAAHLVRVGSVQHSHA